MVVAQAGGKTEAGIQRRRNDNRCLVLPVAVVLARALAAAPTIILP